MIDGECRRVTARTRPTGDEDEDGDAEDSDDVLLMRKRTEGRG